eukprot:scaffold18679_cov59-Phaeocystis_antarctica.AAC.9
MHLELLVRLLERLAVLLRAPQVAVGPEVSARQRRLDLEAVVRQPVDEDIVHLVVLEPAAGGDPRHVRAVPKGRQPRRLLHCTGPVLCRQALEGVGGGRGVNLAGKGGHVVLQVVIEVV